MLIASQYAILSEDKKTLSLPDEVLNWLQGDEQFVVILEHDDLLLKKAHTRKSLDELVTREAPPLSSEELDELIHRSRT